MQDFIAYQIVPFLPVIVAVIWIYGWAKDKGILDPKKPAEKQDAGTSDWERYWTSKKANMTEDQTSTPEYRRIMEHLNK